MALPMGGAVSRSERTETKHSREREVRLVKAQTLERKLGAAGAGLDEQVLKAAALLNSATSNVTDTMQRGVSAVKDQIETVRGYGVEGVRKDMSDFARKQPLKALLIAG